MGFPDLDFALNMLVTITVLTSIVIGVAIGYFIF